MKKKIVSMLLTGTMILGSSSALAYNDTNGHWAESYINSMNNSGVLGQFYEDSIYPDRPITRGECAELISDLLEQHYGYKPKYNNKNNKFSDLYNGTQASKIRALNRLSYRSIMTSDLDIYGNIDDTKIVNGYPDGTFKPNNLVTRAEFSKMLVNALDCFGYIPVANYETYRTDAANHWSSKYIDIAIGTNAIQGYRNYKDPTTGIFTIEFRPDNNITRAEAIKMVSSVIGRQNVELATRPFEYPFYYLIDEVEDMEELRTISNNRFGYQIDIPKDWNPIFSDNGDGFRVVKNFTLSVYGSYNIDNYFDTFYSDFINNGFTIEPINLENSKRAYKASLNDSIHIFALRDSGNSSEIIVSANLTGITPSNPEYDKAIKVLDSFKPAIRGFD